MNLTSSQRWAIGAVTLAVLIACSPKPEEPVQPPPQAPSLSQAATVASATISSTAQARPPGFSGVWASAESECGEPDKTFKLSSATIDMMPGERSCAVKSISEEHPTGRSVIYTVMADCLTEGAASKDQFTLNFGAADTVMQLQLNDREPVRLVRCP
jgi:hypothetical protein